MRPSSRSSRSEPAARASRRSHRPEGLLALAAACLIHLAAAAPAPPAEFRAVTLDGRTYPSSRDPAIKKGYLFLADERGNFFSLPLESIDWSATRRANALLPPDLLERWDEGPVRYLLAFDQAREYRALAGDVQRAAWISRFWGTLDPTPSTFFNERRFEYWSRVERANFLFSESTKPGWRTDRGKFYILLGPPDEVESFPFRSGNDARFDPRYSGDAPAGYPRMVVPPRDVVRWTYRNPPGAALDPGTVIAFRQDASGEYYLSAEGIDYDRVFRDVSARLTSLGDEAHAALRAPAPGTGQQRGERLAEMGRSGVTAISSLALLSDLGEIQKGALARDWLQEIVSAREYFGAFPIRSAFHFYRSQEGLTYVEVNLAVDAPAGERAARRGGAADPGAPPLTLSARLASARGPARRVEFDPDGGFSALPDPEGTPGRWVFQSGAGVAPGTYTLLVAVTDTGTGDVGSWREEVEVPDLSAPGLLLSDLVLAGRVEEEPEGASGAYKRPFLYGRLRLVPDVDRVYRSGSELGFYYQVYGARSDAPGGAPELDLLYRFEILGDGGWQSVGSPIELESQRESSQAYSLALRGWPAGTYRLSVRVTDRGSGQSAERQTDFAVRE